MIQQKSCAICGRALVGRQRRFCGRACKNRDTNHRHQSYRAQMKRGLERKLRLVDECGGRCSGCGYAKNLAALTWHHVDPSNKKFSLDLRSLSNRTAVEIRGELARCILLCANCHAEAHFPRLEMDLLTGLAGRNPAQR